MKKESTSRRVPCFAAKVDFNTGEIYVRPKKAKPEYLERHQDNLSPGLNVYASTLKELRSNIAKLIRNHEREIPQMLKLIKSNNIAMIPIGRKHVVSAHGD